jgi:hypothetical protein
VKEETMSIKTKIALAGSFVGLVAMAAAAFGQTGSGSSTAEQGTDTPRARRAAAAERRDGDRCPDRPYRARRLVHSDTKVKVPSGFATLTVDQGEVTAIDHGAKTITIKRLDGTSVTRTAVDETRVCKDGDPAAFDSLKTGDLARLVYVRSERFTGLRKIVAVTPGSEGSQTPAARPALRPAAGEDPADLAAAI